MTAFVLMGVSGAGKSTIGRQVAAALRVPFIEGDDFHPAANVAKMSAGVPLTDDDRMPWIDALARGINDCAQRDLIVACSALSQLVRQRLRVSVARPLLFVFLTAPPEVIERRLSTRPRHFMKPGMLGTQFAALEAPTDAVTIDVSGPLPATVEQVEHYVRNHREEQRAR